MALDTEARVLGKIITDFQEIHKMWDKLETKVEEKGRITIPARIRRDLGITKGEKLDISAKDGVLILRRKKIVSVSDIKGIIGPSRVKPEDVEEAAGKEK